MESSKSALLAQASETVESKSNNTPYLREIKKFSWLVVVHEISKLLNTGLDRETLTILISLCESGVNPEALAAVVKELARENVGQARKA